MITIKEIPALGTLWWFEIFDAEESQRDTITETIVAHMEQFEANYSRFRPSSHISQLNITGSFENPSEEFIALLNYGKKLYVDTEQVFNFLSAHTQVARGYGSPDTVRQTLDTAPANPTEDLTVTKEKITLTQGAVDLGGFGKGWLVDDLAHLLQNTLQYKYFLINGGGDIYATATPDNQPIEISVEHPTQAGYTIATYPLNNQGFAASSTHKRKWKQGDKEQNHLLTQHGNDITVNIVADTTLTADTFATAASAIESGKLPTLLANNNLEYLIFTSEKVAHTSNFTLLTNQNLA